MNNSRMHVPVGLYMSSAFIQKSKRFWKFLANIETTILADELKAIEIKKPIYIAGVARCGSTILLEMLNQHPDLTSHRYSDFPNIYTPYWRNWLKQKTSKSSATLQERAHQDRIKISEHSPEAIEEVLWMEFFLNRHQNHASQVLSSYENNPKFNTFYEEHLKKLLLIRNKKRYLSKGNYNLTRLHYILGLFPDARFLIPIRNPVNHIASCMKQDKLYQKGLNNNFRAQRYLKWAGHFEFGRNKKFINVGNTEIIEQIQHAFNVGEDVKAWALHWTSLYGFALQQQGANEGLKSASLWIKYEELCHNSENNIAEILDHCHLQGKDFDAVKKYYIKHLQEPNYYKTQFSHKDLKTIENICGETATELGYKL